MNSNQTAWAIGIGITGLLTWLFWPRPASAYCISQGGTIEATTRPLGRKYCHLPNGKVIEEWQFYRQRQ